MIPVLRVISILFKMMQAFAGAGAAGGQNMEGMIRMGEQVTHIIL